MCVVLQEAFPNWTDKFDMLAALRASNYDPHDCMATYMAYGDDSERTCRGINIHASNTCTIVSIYVII